MRELILILLLLVSGVAAAETSMNDRKGPPPDGGSETGGMPADGAKRGPRRPPPEALDACKDKAAGNACSFNDREGMAKNGTCWTPDASKPLACRPNDRDKGQR